MKKLIGIILAITTSALVSTTVNAGSILAGTVDYAPGYYLAGTAIPLGFDPYGYNYQAHQFVGSYFNAYADKAGYPPYDGNDTAYLAANPDASGFWAWPYRNDYLAMKWDDEWLSNEDRNNDGLLDRHYGFPSYIGSGAWLNNHLSGTYAQGNRTIKWNEYTAIVAAPADATLSGGNWYSSSGTEIGPNIWGQFAITLDVYNDPGAGARGPDIISPDGPGYGQYK